MFADNTCKNILEVNWKFPTEQFDLLEIITICHKQSCKDNLQLQFTFNIWVTIKEL